jgi:quinol monooxygenase YgiN
VSVVVVATVFPIDEHRDEVIAAFVAAAEKVHPAEVGCELYAIHTGKDRIVMIEKYADMAALGTHGQSAVLAELGAALDGKTTGGLDVQVLRPHPAGDAAKGVL